MTEATHPAPPVSGYRNLPMTAIDKVNKNKAAEERMLRTLDDLAKDPSIDKRWLAIGRTKLEEAFMAINRSVFRPGRTALPEDSEQEANP